MHASHRNPMQFFSRGILVCAPAALHTGVLIDQLSSLNGYLLSFLLCDYASLFSLAASTGCLDFVYDRGSLSYAL